jgi:hypothetical protein
MRNHTVVAMLNWDEIIPVPIDVGIFLRFVMHFTLLHNRPHGILIAGPAV